MKKTCVVLMMAMWFVFNSFQIYAQSQPTTNFSEIPPYGLLISYSKTTNLIFPSTVVSVDRGSKDVLAQKAKGLENILQVKAGKRDFEQTSLTVITADGTLYSYLVDYADTPPRLNIKYNRMSETAPTAAVSSPKLSQEVQISNEGKAVLANKPFIHRVADKRFDLKLTLEGIYVREGVMYFQLKLKNRSTINYDIDQLRWYVRDQKKAKRTASQEIELVPLQVINDVKQVAGNTSETLVFAFDKITVPDQKELAVQLMEKNGGRNLEIKFGNKTILRAAQVKR